MTQTIFNFIGSDVGKWKVIDTTTIKGKPLPEVMHVEMIQSGETAFNRKATWSLRGVSSNLRYTEKLEQKELASVQQELGRPDATLAALIPIRKTKEWLLLAQDERRKIFEHQSHHIQTGLRYLPPIARKLFHCHDLGEPFDFLTWFEFSSVHEKDFDELVQIKMIA